MLIGEYDYEMDMQEKQAEVREEMEEKLAEVRAEYNAKLEEEIAKAEAKAEAEKAKTLFASLVRKGLLSAGDAAAEMGVSEEIFLKWIE
ncbi:MAG: hypothetical protein ACI4D7_01780 [Lachnospiraceae bacterium]